MFSPFLRGLNEPRERMCLAACVALCAVYVAILLVFRFTGTPVDIAFFARRQEVLLHGLQHSPLPWDVQVHVVDHDRIAESVVLLDGWSIPESWGVWSDGPHAAFAVAPPDGTWGDGAVQIWADVYAPDRRGQTIHMTMGGRALGSWRLSAGTAIICVKPPGAALLQGGVALFSLEFGSPTTPPGGLDKRQLGIGLEQVELLRSLATCSPGAARKLNAG